MWKGGKILYLRQKYGIEFSVDNKILLNAATTLTVELSQAMNTFQQQQTGRLL